MPHGHIDSEQKGGTRIKGNVREKDDKLDTEGRHTSSQSYSILKLFICEYAYFFHSSCWNQ